MGVAQILRDFSGWTSAHGIPHIGSAQNLCLRIFWALIFISSTAMFIFQMTLLINKYLDYDVTVQTELKFEERNFPAVTICNLNPYKTKEAQRIDSMKKLIDDYEKAIKKEDIPTDTYGFKGIPDDDPIAIQSRARDQMMLIAAELNRNPVDADRLNNTLFQKDEFIKNCAYNTKPCLDNDFMVAVDPIYGNCFTFNSEQMQELYKSTRAGPLYGLRILLMSNQSKYLSLTQSAGVRVTVHGQGEESFPDAFGYNAAAGFTTSFGIKFIKTERLSEPYGNCTHEQGGTDYYYKGNFSVEGCFRSCFQKNIKESCSCYDPRFKQPADAPADQQCTTTDLDCMNKFSSSDGENSFNVIQECSCPQPCTEATFGVTVSTALWPSDVYNPPECKEDSPSWRKEDDPNANLSLPTCAEWYGRNTMLIEVYYERMNYQLLTESEAYGLVNLVSDMGGQLGLWMGISVITVVEFFSLLILLCLFLVARRKQQPGDFDGGNSDDEDAQEDDRPPPDYPEKQ